MQPPVITGLPVLLLLAAQQSASEPQVSSSAAEAAPSPQPFWQGEPGEGLKGNTKSFEVRVSRAFGTTDTGSNDVHDLWLAEFQFGLILADVMEPDHWFGGNLEAIGKILTAAQERPHNAYLSALNGGFRYHFCTGTPLVPFIGANVGIGITDINDADATGKFQFNQQAGAGLRYFFDPQTAIVLDYNYWHVSNAGIKAPNDGVNCHVFSLGISWLF